MAPDPRAIPRRELVTLLAYLDAGSHKAAAHRLGISESTCRQRISQLMRRVGARNAAQAVWRLRQHLEGEGSGAPE
jgi:DNA-binding NarL/FixJ family response regulator